MRIAIRYFAVARERAGCEREALELSAPATVASLLEHLAQLHPLLAPLLPRLRVAVNQEFANLEDPIPDGAEVALIPPVAGGGPLAELRDAPLSLEEVVAAVSSPGMGGVVTFTGAVRSENHGQKVEGLTYEAYGGMAERRMSAIIEEARTRFGASVAILHRVGSLKVGELAVVIAAAAPHRAEAFDACRFAIDALKADVPIWKKERTESGEEWVGLGP